METGPSGNNLTRTVVYLHPYDDDLRECDRDQIKARRSVHAGNFYHGLLVAAGHWHGRRI